MKNINLSWIDFVHENLWSQNEYYYEYFVQQVASHLRLENDWRNSWASYWDGKPCSDCGVSPGEIHMDMCCVERCPDCGGQYISCGCTSAFNRMPWSGEWPGSVECKEFGWYAKLTGSGWIACDQDDPEAHPDLNRLHAEAVWSKEQQRFVSPGKEALYGQPIPSDVWEEATSALARYIIVGLQLTRAGKPKTGPLYDEFCLVEAEYNQKADRIWYGKWTPEQQNEWNLILISPDLIKRTRINAGEPI